MAEKALSFEQIQLLFQELAEEHKKMSQEAALRSQEAASWSQEVTLQLQEAGLRFQEAGLRFQELDRLQKKTDRQINKLSKNMGGLNRSMGELIETLIAARLWEKFAAYPYNLQRAYQCVPIYDENNRVLTDVDILLSDTEWVMAVEVKRKPDREDIDHHVRRMERIRKYPPAEAKGKKLLGAIAGGAVDPDVKDYAHKAGFFALELKGESVALIPLPDGFSPKIW